MRKITFFKSMLVIIAMIIGSISANAQLLVEDFSYTVGSTITATATADPTTGWLGHSSAGTANIPVTNGLSFTGYAGSGVGGAANLANTGEDINKPFTAQTTGTVYVAFLVNITANTTAGYFFHLGPSPLTTTFYSRVFVNGTANGIGLSASSTAPATFVTVTTGSTVMVVLKHNFTLNTTDMFVLNSFSATEPASASQSIPETYASVGAVALRQYNAAQRIVVDGIRVGTTWAEASAPPASTPKVETPTFSAIPGNVIATQSVSLASTTAGASLYYTTDGTDPNNTGNGTLFTGTPISVSTTTTVKAIGYKTANDPSSIATATYTFPTDIATVSQLRAASVSGFYKLTGEAVLTYQSTTGNVKYIQDATAGIVIYDGTPKITTVYNIGDGIKNIYCTLSLYNGMLELIPFADPGAANSTGNTVTPAIVTLANLANYQGQLVTVKNVTITGTGNFVASTSYVINDGTASQKLRTAYTDLPYVVTPTAIPTVLQDITGVVFNTVVSTIPELDLIPRSANDIVNTPVLINVAESFIPNMSVSVPTRSITVSGSNLSGDITLAISGTNAAQFDVSPKTLTPAGGSVSSTSVFVTYTNNGSNSDSALLTLSSPGATPVTFNLVGGITTALSQPISALSVSASDGFIRFTAQSGQLIELYNAVGQKLLIKQSVEGLNSIPVSTKGLVVLKMGNQIAKVVL